jgi:hypothetical protein
VTWCLAKISPCVKYDSRILFPAFRSLQNSSCLRHISPRSHCLSARRRRGRRGRWAVCAGARSRSAGAGAGHVVPEAVGDDPVGGVRGVVGVPEHVRLAVAAGRRVRQAEPSHLRVHAAARRVRRREPCTRRAPPNVRSGSRQREELERLGWLAPILPCFCGCWMSSMTTE